MGSEYRTVRWALVAQDAAADAIRAQVRRAVVEHREMRRPLTAMLDAADAHARVATQHVVTLRNGGQRA